MYGRGRGGWGRGGGGFGRGAQLQSEQFPEIEGLGKARYSESKRQLITWSMDLQKIWKASPYYYESAKKVKKADIEIYSDRVQRATNKKRPLEHYVFMDADHLPGELAKAGGGARVAKNVCWDIGFDEAFKKVEERAKGRVNELKMLREADEEDKEEEDDDDEGKDYDDDDDEESNDDDDKEYIYEFDDDEDDFNKADSDNNEDDTYEL